MPAAATDVKLDNGIGIPADFHLTGHNLYSQVVEQKMDELLLESGGNLEVASNLLTQFISEIKTLIQNNPNMTLGEISTLIN